MVTCGTLGTRGGVCGMFDCAGVVLGSFACWQFWVLVGVGGGESKYLVVLLGRVYDGA